MVLKYFRYYVESIFQQKNIVPLQVTRIIYICDQMNEVIK